MHSVSVLSQLLVSILFFVMLKIPVFHTLFVNIFLVKELYSCAQNNMRFLHRQDNSMAMIWWLGYTNCNIVMHCISLIT